MHYVRTSSTRATHPINRPLYMYTGEVPLILDSTVALCRETDATYLRVHPGSPTVQVAADIAALLHSEEARAWLAPFGLYGPIDLAAIRSDPVRTLGTLTGIPSQARNIPQGLRMPWAPWLYN